MDKKDFLPFFSIIMPIHNAADHMRKGLDSIKAAIQVYKEKGGAAELICICDSCTDNSAAIAAEYTTFVYETDYHRDGLARNRGLEIAEATWKEMNQWIMFMDDDDWWIHEYVLCELAQLLQKHDNKKMGAVAFSFIWKGLGYIRPIRSNGSYWPAVWSKVWKRSAIEGCRFSDKWSESDMDFNTDVYVKWNGGRDYDIYDVDMCIYYYNFLRKGSITEGDGKYGVEDVVL